MRLGGHHTALTPVLLKTFLGLSVIFSAKLCCWIWWVTFASLFINKIRIFGCRWEIFLLLNQALALKTPNRRVLAHVTVALGSLWSHFLSQFIEFLLLLPHALTLNFFAGEKASPKRLNHDGSPNFNSSSLSFFLAQVSPHKSFDCCRLSIKKSLECQLFDFSTR